jgi:hypothetical protein
MSLFLSNRDGGLTDEQGHYRFQTNVWNGHVIGNGLQVTQNSPLGMSVIVGEGDTRVPYAGYAYTAWNDANEVVTISTANPSNPRIDRLVMYIDRGETPQQVNPNNPGIPKFAVVAGTPAAVPTRPSNAAVNSAVGATNPWINLADILVNAGVTQITNANITRTAISVTQVVPTSFLARSTSTQSTSNATFQKITTYNSLVFNNGGGYIAGSSQFRAPTAGLYNFGASIAYSTGFSQIYRHILMLYVNGTEALRLFDGGAGGTSSTFAFGGSGILQLQASDIVEVYMWRQVNASMYAYGGGPQSWFYGYQIGGTQ